MQAKTVANCPRLAFARRVSMTDECLRASNEGEKDRITDITIQSWLKIKITTQDRDLLRDLDHNWRSLSLI